MNGSLPTLAAFWKQNSTQLPPLAQTLVAARHGDVDGVAFDQHQRTAYVVDPDRVRASLKGMANA